MKEQDITAAFVANAKTGLHLESGLVLLELSLANSPEDAAAGKLTSQWYALPPEVAQQLAVRLAEQARSLLAWDQAQQGQRN
ncbi:hypothetical protein [Cupriavidus basilensis]|uniref:Uncharacterized protein n=1 Tax=Cupriavidus basilensis TaxID=68895 RepID=A0A643FMR3_9BURK|nr:hypothetical protein [Cupriavidus basilensis]QOT77903.1 hypothetical protein F7R26_007725 [Cupriavidus basilensis]